MVCISPLFFLEHVVHPLLTCLPLLEQLYNSAILTPSVSTIKKANYAIKRHGLLHMVLARDGHNQLEHLQNSLPSFPFLIVKYLYPPII